jgi:hypothetical protein
MDFNPDAQISQFQRESTKLTSSKDVSKENSQHLLHEPSEFFHPFEYSA